MGFNTIFILGLAYSEIFELEPILTAKLFSNGEKEKPLKNLLVLPQAIRFESLDNKTSGLDSFQSVHST